MLIRSQMKHVDPRALRGGAPLHSWPVEVTRTLRLALRSRAARAIAWIGLAASCYPALWGKDGAGPSNLDAWIYYHAVAQWHAGGSLYDWYANPAQHLWPFTYPPFAALALTPLTWGSDRTAQVLLVAATPLCVAATLWVLLRRLGAAKDVAAGAAPWLALAAFTALEPVPKTMEYGQVNALLMALVALDLLAVPERSRLRGALSGLAAAFKLTPAIAVLVLLARREWRAAATMVGTAAAVTAACWAVWPAESTEFFTRAMWDPGRAGFADYSGNQNLKGAVARWLPEAAWTPAWGLCVLGAVAGAWLLLRRLDRLRADDGGDGPAGRGTDEAGADDGLVLCLQVCVAMMAGLLVSPISWSHHWVWCAPAIIALAAAGRRWRAPGLLTTAGAGAAVFVLAMQWWFPEQNHVEQDWPAWATVVGSSYTWWALATGAVLARSLPARAAPERPREAAPQP